MSNHRTDFFEFPEIGLTYRNPADLVDCPTITNAREAYDLMRMVWDDNKLDLLEQANMLLLNGAKKLLGVVCLSSGGKDFAALDIRLVFAAAIKANANSIILAHNHPSGKLKPSSSDINLTRKIEEAGRILDLHLEDHLIITRTGYYSILEDICEVPFPIERALKRPANHF